MVEKDDPIKKAEKESITPEFLNNVKGSKKEDAARNLGEFEKMAGSSSLGDSSSLDDESRESLSSSGSYRPKALGSGKGSKRKFKKKVPLATIGIGLFLMVPVAIVALNNPITLLGALDNNLMESLNFKGTVAVLEKIALRIIGEKASNGRIPSKLANDMAEQGFIFGQVTPSGDFVRTNNYIADLDGDLEIAASGFDYHLYGSEGELSILYNGEIIKAEDFVLAVESDPEKYKNYIDAVKIKAAYFVDAAQEVYKKLGLSLINFYDWETTGNAEEDQKNFNEKISEILDDDISAAFAGCSEGDEGCTEGDLNSDSVISEAINAGGDTNNTSQVLTMAISSTEPLRAARAFLAIEEPIQRARLDGTGPANQVMDTLYRRTGIWLTDVNTNVTSFVEKAILETANFVAGASQGHYSISEANNFQRDRALIATGTRSSDGIGDVIKESVLDNKTVSSPVAIVKKIFGVGVDTEAIEKARDSVRVATMDFNSDNFSSILGGNRAIEGGSYIVGAINRQLIGSMPADKETVVAYQQEVDKILALRDNAERSTLSPFDTSSPNTFLGNIKHRIASAYLNQSSSGNAGLVSAVGTFAGLVGESAGDLMGDAIADGDDRNYMTIAGECSTVSQAYNSMGDIYCNEVRSLVTDFIDKPMPWWQDKLGDEIDANGKPKKDSDLAKFKINGANREATVGVRSAAICTADESSSEGVFDKIKRILFSDTCDDDVATGAKYTLSKSNNYSSKVKLYEGYLMYDQVNSLLENVKSQASIFMEEYYSEHPLDNSVAGRIARMSGMTKSEAELALNYASYLARIRNYDPSQKFAFGGFDLKLESPQLIVDDTSIKETLYCYWQGKIEYSDLRNRSQIA